MQVIREGELLRNYGRYFYVTLLDPLVIKIWQFRSEDQYDEDDDSAIAEITALSFLRRTIDCTGKKGHLAYATNADYPSSVRSYKGTLWGYDELRSQDNLPFELPGPEKTTRIGAVVDLSHFDFRSSADRLLSFMSLIVISRMDTKDVLAEVEEWVVKDSKHGLSFDYDAIGHSLRYRPDMAVLRYFPADRGRHEVIAILGCDSFIDNEMSQCISAIYTQE